MQFTESCVSSYTHKVANKFAYSRLKSSQVFYYNILESYQTDQDRNCVKYAKHRKYSQEKMLGQRFPYQSLKRD